MPLFLDEVRALAPLAAGEVVTYSYLAEEQLCAPYAERAALLQGWGWGWGWGLLCAPYAERAALLQVRVRVRVGVYVGYSLIPSPNPYAERAALLQVRVRVRVGVRVSMSVTH
eukprot:scaffold22821_cov51-Phaeocystis_antarctica.AAC.3